MAVCLVLTMAEQMASWTVSRQVVLMAAMWVEWLVAEKVYCLVAEWVDMMVCWMGEHQAARKDGSTASWTAVSMVFWKVVTWDG